MAIIVEEEKKSSSGSVFLGGVIIVIILAASAYYLFFAAPPAVVATPPPNFAIIQPIANININTQGLTSNPNFAALKSYIAEPTSTGPGAVGRTDPFVTP